jgi:hypothetical protein
MAGCGPLRGDIQLQLLQNFLEAASGGRASEPVPSPAAAPVPPPPPPPVLPPEAPLVPPPVEPWAGAVHALGPTDNTGLMRRIERLERMLIDTGTREPERRSVVPPVADHGSMGMALLSEVPVTEAWMKELQTGGSRYDERSRDCIRALMAVRVAVDGRVDGKVYLKEPDGDMLGRGAEATAGQPTVAVISPQAPVAWALQMEHALVQHGYGFIHTQTGSMTADDVYRCWAAVLAVPAARVVVQLSCTAPNDVFPFFTLAYLAGRGVSNFVLLGAVPETLVPRLAPPKASTTDPDESGSEDDDAPEEEEASLPGSIGASVARESALSPPLDDADGETEPPEGGAICLPLRWLTHPDDDAEGWATELEALRTAVGIVARYLILGGATEETLFSDTCEGWPLPEGPPGPPMPQDTAAHCGAALAAYAAHRAPGGWAAHVFAQLFASGRHASLRQGTSDRASVYLDAALRAMLAGAS